MLPSGQPDPRYRNPKYEEPLAGAEPFDEAMQCWACTLQGEPILETAPRLLHEALACGFDGCVMLHGIMDAQGNAAEHWTVEEDCFHCEYEQSVPVFGCWVRGLTQVCVQMAGPSTTG